MFGNSFLTARGDLLMDGIVLSLVAIVPTLIYSWKLARDKKYLRHKNTQIVVFVVLLVAVLLFEYDLKSQGGIWEMTKESRFAGSAFLANTVYIHLFFSFSTAFFWVILVPLSLYWYRKELRPNKHSRVHKVLGKLTMVLTLGTGITGTFLYFIGMHF
jgi:putative membrane protein